ncbi:MAG: transcriptional repressor [Spirochaetaceae bacterium]|jgi:Fur family ferric uptake transcriptional regulator|nr:transcriptional repressor [Spirochaetaceae bacterium]
MKQNRPTRYTTSQGKQILEYLASLGDTHVTAYEIVRHFAAAEVVIGQTTVYRHLERLAAEGKIRKYLLSDGRSACYQYISGSTDCREHFHLKCEQCGALIHVACTQLDQMQGHLRNKHDFQINLLKTTLYGTCGNCLTADKA